jgi:hypothetical protein
VGHASPSAMFSAPFTMATADIYKRIQARREHRPPTFDGN